MWKVQEEVFLKEEDVVVEEEEEEEEDGVVVVEGMMEEVGEVEEGEDTVCHLNSIISHQVKEIGIARIQGEILRLIPRLIMRHSFNCLRLVPRLMYMCYFLIIDVVI